MKDHEALTEFHELLRKAGKWDDSARVPGEQLASSMQDAEAVNLAWSELARFAGTHGDFKNARRYIDRAGDSYEKVECLTKLASRDIEKAGRGFLAEAAGILEASGRNWGTLWQRAELLGRLATACFIAGFLDDANRHWQSAVTLAQEGERSADTQDALDCGSVLGEIAVQLAEAGLGEKAMEVSGTIQNGYRRSKVTKQVSEIVSGKRPE